MEKCVSIENCKKSLKTWFSKKFHDFPRTCCKSNWRLSFLTYFGSDFCKKSWFAQEKEFSHLKLNFTWKVGFSWKFPSFHENRSPDLKIINFGLVFVCFSHTRRTVVDDCFSTTTHAESAPERMQNAKIILFLMKNMLRTSKKGLVLATRLQRARAGSSGSPEKWYFLKIDTFYGKGRILRENALLEPRGEKV